MERGLLLLGKFSRKPEAILGKISKGFDSESPPALENVCSPFTPPCPGPDSLLLSRAHCWSSLTSPATRKARSRLTRFKTKQTQELSLH